MRTKLHLASGIAAAATMFVALMTAESSVASAEELLPQIVEDVVVDPVGAKPTFVSNPVIQPVPDATAAEAPAEDRDLDATDGSLRELVAVQPQPGALPREMQCLAGAIYFEARGETLEGQLAVGRVIIERAKSGRFPNNYCGVVFQRAQFSFVRGGKMPQIREGSNAWKRAVAMAQIAHDGSWESPVEGALFFHAARISPGWRLTRIARVDNHVFYR